MTAEEYLKSKGYKRKHPSTIELMQEYAKSYLSREMPANDELRKISRTHCATPSNNVSYYEGMKALKELLTAK